MSAQSSRAAQLQAMLEKQRRDDLDTLTERHAIVIPKLQSDLAEVQQHQAHHDAKLADLQRILYWQNMLLVACLGTTVTVLVRNWMLPTRVVCRCAAFKEQNGIAFPAKPSNALLQ